MFHELAHILLGHIEQENGTSEQDEKNADAWARDTLINSGSFEEFRNKRDFSENNVCSFAKEMGIAPGIVVGRLQNEGCIKHSMLNELKEHYKIVG